MTTLTSDSLDRLDNCVARLLAVGTWTSCGLVMTGMLLPVIGVCQQSTDMYVVSTGIALLIALPAMRVATMGVWFLLHNDRDFALIAAFVLAIIIASTLLGIGAA